MSLADFIAATQAEMKSRIEEECKKQMMALLEASFSTKWEEYTSKTVESASATPLYSKQYGKLDLEKDYEGKPNWTPDIIVRIKPQIAKITFSSKNIYFIHACIKITYGGGGQSYDVMVIDNYGFHHHISASTSWAGYPDKPYTIDITKPVGTEKYLYPLPNSMIDVIRAFPNSVDPRHCGDSLNREIPGGQIQHIVMNLPQIRKAAEIFHEQATATEKLLSQKKTYEATLAENEAMKARIAELEVQLAVKDAKLREIEASSPSEDLLGLVECETEPSKTLVSGM